MFSVFHKIPLSSIILLYFHVTFRLKNFVTISRIKPYVSWPNISVLNLVFLTFEEWHPVVFCSYQLN